MNNDTLNSRKEQLVARQNELVKQAEDVEKQIQVLFRQKEQIVANANAVAGAMQLLTELLQDVEGPVSTEAPELTVVETECPQTPTSN